MTLLLVFVGGAIGAPLRYLTDRAIAARMDPVFPWGTLAVNVLASLLLGVLTTATLVDWAYPLLGTGLAGALSTYSTFGYETLRLLQDGAKGYAYGNAVGNVLASVAAAGAGMWLGGAIFD